METFEEFEQHLRDGLTHLYDPAYQPPAVLRLATGNKPEQGAQAVQQALIEAIETLKPGPDVPPNARIWRVYELLSGRYVQGLTQAQMAQRLNITVRYVRREQQYAVQVLARRLWDQQNLTLLSPTVLPQDTTSTLPETTAETQSTTWRSQVREELATLQQHAPGMVSNIETEIRGVAKLGAALAATSATRLMVDAVPANLSVTIHPSALRQILLTAIEKLIPFVAAGQIHLGAKQTGRQVLITISGLPAPGVLSANLPPPDSELIQEILATNHGSVQINTLHQQISFQVTLPTADIITVLVVDDNADLVHFYRRYTTGTRYQIVSVGEGQQVFEMIETTKPGLIVLDVMLPDIDGWELLSRLKEDATTQSIPVIICSVIRREALALALGAVQYIAKPVRHRQFVEALDEALATIPKML